MQTSFPKNVDGDKAKSPETSSDSAGNSVEAWRCGGEKFQAERNFPEAVLAFRRAVELDPHNAVIHCHLGIALAGCGNEPEAVEAFKRALAIRPDYPEALNNLGSVLENQGRLAEAGVCFERAVQIDPRFAVGLNNLGLIRLKLGRVDDAVAAFKQALALQQNIPETFCNLGRAFSQQNAFDNSIFCFERALELQPDYPEANYHLGVALRKCMRLPEAVNAFNNALFQKPDYPEVLEELDRILQMLRKLDEIKSVNAKIHEILSARRSWVAKRLEGQKRLHLACGSNILDGWANIDIEDKGAVIGWDLTDPLPVHSGSIELVFCEHFIEHVTLKQGIALLADWRRVLQPEGILRLSTPDLRMTIDAYLAGNLSEWHDVGWSPATPCQMVNEGLRLWGHQFVYDADELRRIIEGAGFSRVTRVAWRESETPALRNLECRPNHNEIIFEAVK